MDNNKRLAQDLALLNLLASARTMVAACGEDNRPAAGDALADLIDALAPYAKVAS